MKLKKDYFPSLLGYDKNRLMNLQTVMLEGTAVVLYDVEMDIVKR